MDLYFILKQDDKYHTLKSTFHPDVLHIELEDTITETNDINTLSNNKLVTLEDIGDNNYNLLNIANATTLRNLRKKIFNKTYIPKTIEKKINIMIDCFLRMYEMDYILFNDEKETNEDDIKKEDDIETIDNNDTKKEYSKETIDDLIETKDVFSETEKNNQIEIENNIKPKKTGSRVMMLLAIGFISGFYTKKYLIK